jgi:hypothetical protein
MSIITHKGGLLLGRQSDAIVTSDLVGNWDPSTGVQTNYWDNQVGGGNNLRRFNGISKTNSLSAHFWVFDGTDDYLGEASSGYGGSAFTLNVDTAFTLAQWVKWDSTKEHAAFSVFGDSINKFALLIGVTSANKASLFLYGKGSATVFDYTFADDTWHYITAVHKGSLLFEFYINGSFIGTVNHGGGEMTEYGVGNLRIGRNGSTYTDSTIKVGKVHVYTAALNASQIRQNFLASHDVNNVRVYGATYTQ